jgi:hypothetical protein
MLCVVWKGIHRQMSAHIGRDWCKNSWRHPPQLNTSRGGDEKRDRLASTSGGECVSA